MLTTRARGRRLPRYGSTLICHPRGGGALGVAVRRRASLGSTRRDSEFLLPAERGLVLLSLAFSYFLHQFYYVSGHTSFRASVVEGLSVRPLPHVVTSDVSVVSAPPRIALWPVSPPPDINAEILTPKVMLSR